MRRPFWLLLALVPAALAAGASLDSDWLGSERSFHTLAQPPAGLTQAPADPEEAPDEEGVPPDLLAEAARWNTPAQLTRVDVPASATSLDFAVIGDAEPGRFIWSRVLFGKKGVFAAQLKRIEGENAAFVLQLGDMVSRGIPRNYRRFYEALDGSGLTRPYLPVIGNHDRLWPHGDPDASLYEALFGPRDYAFDAGPVRLVAVDSSLGKLAPRQLAWLDGELATDRRKIVFTHMPPAQFKSWTVGMTGIRDGGEEFVELMARRKVDRVYLGHIHGFGYAQKDGVRYVLSGGGGSPLYLLPTRSPQLFYHYLTVSLTPDAIRETVHPLEGAAFDLIWPKSGGDFEFLLTPPEPSQVASAH